MNSPFQGQFHRSYTSGSVRCIVVHYQEPDNLSTSIHNFIPDCLSVCSTNISTSLFKAGVMEHFSWQIPLAATHSSNSQDVNWGPLSENCFGNPNKDLNTPSVLSVVVISIGSTSSHLEWLSTVTKNTGPTQRDPAKSMCALPPWVPMARARVARNCI